MGQRINDNTILYNFMESWEDSYQILLDANKQAEKYRSQVDEIMENETLSNDNYTKIKELLEKESSVRNNALTKVEEIRREHTKNLEQQLDE